MSPPSELEKNASPARQKIATTKALEAMLACGFDPDHPDASIGKTALHAAAMEGSRTSRTDRDHAAVGQLLLDAGSPVDWQQGDEPSEAIVDIVNAWRGLS